MNKTLLLIPVALCYTATLAQTISPPQLTCAPNTTVECGSAVSLSAFVSDTNGVNLTVVWALNGTSTQTSSVDATSASSGANLSFSAVLPFGNNVVSLNASDTAGNSVSCSTEVSVVDTTPPTIDSVAAKPSVLWPPNHKMASVGVNALVTDECGPVTWKVISVSSNEGANAKGSGHTSPDWTITGDHTVSLRSERTGKGRGRIYTITIQATDVGGNVSQASTTVTVPHDQGKKSPPNPAPPPHGHGHRKP